LDGSGSPSPYFSITLGSPGMLSEQ
jgi:hypothetical protein